MHAGRFLLALGFSLTLAAVPSRPAWGLTLSQMENATRVLVRDTASDTNYQRFSSATLDGFLNEAQRDFQNRTWLARGLTDINIVGGTNLSYFLPADFLGVIRLYAEGSNGGMVGYDLHELNIQTRNANIYAGAVVQQGGQSQSGIYVSSPTAFFVNNFNYEVAGSSPTIEIYPWPTTTNALDLFYAIQLPQLVNPTDVPFKGVLQALSFHDALVDFAAARCWQLLGRSDLSDFHMKQYLARVDIAKLVSFKPVNTATGMK